MVLSWIGDESRNISGPPCPGSWELTAKNPFDGFVSALPEPIFLRIGEAVSSTMLVAISPNLVVLVRSLELAPRDIKRVITITIMPPAWKLLLCAILLVLATIFESSEPGWVDWAFCRLVLIELELVASRLYLSLYLARTKHIKQKTLVQRITPWWYHF